MKLDLSVDNFAEEVDKKPRSPEKYFKGVAIYNTSMDKFLCREFVDDDGYFIDFTWKENTLWLLDDSIFSQVIKNIEWRDNGLPISKEMAQAKRSVIDFLWEWNMGDCTTVNCQYYRWTVHNRRGIIYGLGQLFQGKGYPSSELIPETHEEIFIDVDHVHPTSLLSLRNGL